MHFNENGQRIRVNAVQPTITNRVLTINKSPNMRDSHVADVLAAVREQQGRQGEIVYTEQYNPELSLISYKTIQ